MPLISLFTFFLVLTQHLGAQTDAELSLADALRIALQNSPSVLIAQKEADAARARVLQAEAIPNLEFGVSWSETPSDFSLADADERSIGFTQPFEFPGKRKARGQVAGHEARIAEDNLDRARLLVTAVVKQSYYRAVLNQKLVSNFESISDLLRQFQEMATVRYQAQSVPLLEVLRAKVELAKVNNQLTEVRREFENSKADLNRLLGRSGATPIVLTDDLFYEPFEKSVEEVVEELRSVRPSLRIAESFVERNHAATRLAKKGYLPDFSFGLFNQSLKEQPPFNANQFTGSRENNNWTIDLGLSFPLWFWKRPRGEVREAQAVLSTSLVQRDAVERNVTTAIENAYRVVKASEAQVRVFEGSLLRDIEDELHAGITLYRNDQIDALNLIDIYRTYTETKAEYFRALYNFNVALADLEAAGEEEIESRGF
jgi:outer membrane protein TolC